MASLRGYLRPLALLSLLGLPSGCAETELQPALSLPSVSFEELKQRVSRIRGLALRQDLTLEARPGDEVEAQVKNALSEKPSHGDQNLWRVYVRLGLLPASADLAKAIIDLHRLQGSAYYNSGRKAIILSQSSIQHAQALRFPGRSTGEAVRQLLLIHALTRALQEQHFNWRQRIEGAISKDSELALKAIANGDAVLVGLEYALGDAKDMRQRIFGAVQALLNSEEFIERELSHLPELLRREVIFQYLQGSLFALWGYSLKGWQGINALFHNPPLSSKQVLHPEKFYLEREDPVRIYPWGLVRQLGGQKILEETLGEFRIQVLLGSALPKAEAQKAASGWAGDNLLAVQAGRDLILAWVTAWDNREGALEFYRSYRTWLEKRYGTSLQRSTTSADILIAQPQNHPPLLLQLRENFVFFLDGLPAPRSVEIAEELWKELETETEPQEIPLDVVRVDPQLPSLMK